MESALWLYRVYTRVNNIKRKKIRNPRNIVNKIKNDKNSCKHASSLPLRLLVERCLYPAESALSSLSSRAMIVACFCLGNTRARAQRW